MKPFYSCLRIIFALALMAGGLYAESISPPPVVSIVADSVPGQPAQHGIDKMRPLQNSFERMN
jgi:hypothetical protein